MSDSLEVYKVANIIEEGKLGGPQVRIANVAFFLKGKVNTVVVMPSDNSESFQKLCMDKGVEYKPFWLSRISKSWSMAARYLFFFPYEVLILTSFFKKENFDLVHISGGSWQYKGLLAAKLSNKKVVWHLNDTSMPVLFKWVFSFLAPLTSAYIFASQRSLQYYNPLIKKNKQFFIVPAPVDSSYFDPACLPPKTDDHAKGVDKKIIIGTVANVNPIKGVEVFLKAAAELNKNNDFLEFVVVGAIHATQQAYYESLMELCEELSLNNVQFTGGGQDVRASLQSFDIYCCSSVAESSPMSVWEAMSMEKPIVSTDVGDVPVYIDHGENGFIVDVGDYKSMCIYVEKLINNRQQRIEFGKKCRNVVIDNLDLEFCAKKHVDAYRSIINS